MNNKKERVAAIDIGSSSIRMTIAHEINEKIEILEELQLSVRLGKDAFYKGKIFRETIDSCILILNRFKKLCSEYKVTKIRAVATTAVRESSNIDIFIDNIRTFTGIEVEILTPIKESEYVYRTLSNQIKDKTAFDDYHCIIEVGAGSVEITIFDQNCIIFSSSLPIGAVKMKQIFEKGFSSEDNFSEYLKIRIEHELRNLKRNIPYQKIKNIYAIGPELNFLSHTLKSEAEDPMLSIPVKELSRFCSQIQHYTDQELVHKLKVPYDLSETLYAVSFMFYKMIDFFQCSKIFITQISLKDCLIEDMIRSVDREKFFQQIKRQIIINSLNIGRSLNFDEKHALKVMELSMELFELTKKIHQLGQREQCYLIAAALLHDIGASITNSSHHKHSLYIIKAQDFFYFNSEEKNMIANIARYHRRAFPRNTHSDYMALSHKNRMTVMKLSAILRIADSLDNSHLQLIKDIKLEIKQEKLILTIHVEEDIFAEAYSFKLKKDLFEEFFGYSVKLKVIKNGKTT